MQSLKTADLLNSPSTLPKGFSPGYSTSRRRFPPGYSTSQQRLRQLQKKRPSALLWMRFILWGFPGLFLFFYLAESLTRSCTLLYPLYLTVLSHTFLLWCTSLHAYAFFLRRITTAMTPAAANANTANGTIGDTSPVFATPGFPF